MTDERWWVDVQTGAVQRDDERGPDRNVLGPYPTREAAEGWRRSHEGREDAWEDEDERWEGEEPPASTT